MAFDARITEESVLEAIYADEQHTVWSPCTTLARMGIERYPHVPRDNHRAMKRVLEALHARGQLVRRDRRHSYFTFKETAYEREPAVAWERRHRREAADKEECG